MLSLSASGLLEYVGAYGSGMAKGLKGLRDLSEANGDDLSNIRKILLQANGDIDTVTSIFRANIDQTDGRVPTAYVAATKSLRRQIDDFMSKFSGSLATVIAADSKFKRDMGSFSTLATQYLSVIEGVGDPKLTKEAENVAKAKKAFEDAVGDLSYAIGGYISKNTVR